MEGGGNLRRLQKYSPTKFMAKNSKYNKKSADFAVNFISCLKHTKGEWYGQNFELIDWQEQIVRDIFGILKPNSYRQFNMAYIEIPKKQGKQLALDTPIPTPDGWSKMGDLKVGGFVFDESGNPCRIIAVSEIDDTEQAYEIIFRDGSSIAAGERHEWFGHFTQNKIKPCIFTTGELYRRMTSYSRFYFRIPIAKAIIPRDKRSRSHFHYIKDIVPVGKTKMRCIQVDSPSHLYLAGKSMIPTHNSELAAAVALLLTCGDSEYGGEIYGCASDRQQASIVFDVAVQMVEQCPALKNRIKPVISQKRLLYKPLGSFYQVLSSESFTKHGLNVHGVVFDEIHAAPNRKLYDVMIHGSGDARKQPLYFLITTAGYDRNSICWELHEKSTDILSARKHDPSFYPVIYSAEENEDWTNEEVWKKANPSLGITVDIEKLRTACASAKENPAEENLFRQLRLNQWVKQSIRWMPMDKWDKCALEINADDFLGRECYGGLDLSSTTDITAFVLVFPPHGNFDKYAVLPYFWIPEDTIGLRVRRDHVPYDIWHKKGFLKTTEGNVVHYAFIERFIEELGTKYNIREIGFDRWGAVQMTQNLEEIGFTVVPFGQGFKDMSPPTKELMKLTLEGKIAHDGNPALRWMMDNIFIKTDPAGNIKPDKEKSTEKIDGSVALIMALDRAIRHDGGGSSIYDERGILLL